MGEDLNKSLVLFTVCASLSRLVHVTVVPTDTVRLAGVKSKLSIITSFAVAAFSAVWTGAAWAVRCAAMDSALCDMSAAVLSLFHWTSSMLDNPSAAMITILCQCNLIDLPDCNFTRVCSYPFLPDEMKDLVRRHSHRKLVRNCLMSVVSFYDCTTVSSEKLFPESSNFLSGFV